MVNRQGRRGFIMLILCITLVACASTRAGSDMAVLLDKTTSGPHISAPIVSDHQIYFGAGYCLYRLNTDGQSLEDILCTPGWTYDNIAVDEHRIYAHMYDYVDRASSFTAVDLQTRKILWQTEVRDRTSWTLSYGETLRFKDLVITVQPDARGHKDRIAVFRATTGELVWTSRSTYIRNPHPLTIQGDLLWYVWSNRDGKGSLVALEPTTGRRMDRVRLRGLDFDQILAVTDAQIIGHDSIPNMGLETIPDRVISVDRERKELDWEISLAIVGRIFQSARHDEILALYSGGSEIYGLDTQTGEILWTTTFRSSLAADSAPGRVHPFVVTDWRDDTIYGVEIVTGRILWHHQMDNDMHPTHLIVDGSSVYLLTSKSVRAISTVDGKLLWERKVDTAIEYLVDYLDRRKNE